MELKTYSSEQICALDYAAYSTGDVQAGRRIQAEVTAGTSLKELARLAETFRRGANTPMSVAARNGQRATQKEIFEAGVSLDADAKAIMATTGLTYTKAFARAQQAAPSTAHVYSRGMKLEAPDVGQLKVNAQRFDAHAYAVGAPGADTEQSPITVLANLATGLKLADGQIDFAKAATAVNNGIDETIRKRAATESLDELVKRWPNKSRDEIEREHRSLAAASLTGVYSAESLKDLLWSLAR